MTTKRAAIKFTCPQSYGLNIYPDQLNCTSFYFCFGPIDYHLSCPADKFFDAQTKQCGNSSDNCFTSRLSATASVMYSVALRTTGNMKIYFCFSS